MKRPSFCVSATGLVVFAALVSGCDSPGFTKKAQSPASLAGQPIGTATTSSAGLPDGAGLGQPVETSGLSVSDAIAKACGIPPGKTATPSFEFDSASLGDDDRAMLTTVAKCLTEGALRGRAVALVGRADPRGEPEYNMNLGGSRADSVRRYLQDLGVGKEKLHTTSRGELDAVGKDEAGWAKDRRVDVELM